MAAKRSKAGTHRRSGPQQLRIIGGEWRGRNIAIGDRDALRPTPNRVRETLFNWLGPGIQQARCLDLFAGSGALGIEALSRGAAHCDFIEQDAATARELRQTLDALRAGQRAIVVVNDALALCAPQIPWDVVFIDPPFAARLAPDALRLLTQPGWLAAGADIYIETATDDPALDQLPDGFACRRDKRAGDVRYALVNYQP
ncbi:MAG: 16S rRNA (guanine(966)-N(2))-methyltransferase RsmD [Halieaceae bacterium]|jgi:16S rRNA (guanine966-N2)-methyltransferase|nr:16S rRNA (guanine(966)-N(2))-methyltransferase RsmD [Halieaceae bacterium]